MAGLSGAAARRSLRAASLVWLVALPASVYIASHATLAAAPVKAFAFGVYALGSVICHQRPERSFFLWGVQLPVCARCVGVYLGAALSALAVVTTRRESRPPSLSVGMILVASAGPAFLTLVYEWTRGGPPGGVTRAMSGVPIGASMMWAVLACIRDARNR